MSEFPRTEIGGVSVPRLICGTNWFLGYSHQTKSRDEMIKRTQGAKQIADVLEVFVRRGCDMLFGHRQDAPLVAAVKEVEQRTGRAVITLGTPSLDLDSTPDVDAKNARVLDSYAEMGCTFCWPHQCTTDAMVNRHTRRIEGMDRFCEMIRQRGMKPGLSTHMPEAPIYADETELDVDGYIQIYNAAGFLMQVEVDWIQNVIWNRKKPVLTIKPLAAGRLPPLVGLAFSWATLRPIDMVTVGCYTADEAKEVIDLSLSLLEGRGGITGATLQKSRSKASL